MRLQILRDTYVESEIGVPPDYVDWNIKRFQSVKRCCVPADFLEDLGRHLRKSGAGAGSFPKVEVVIDDRSKHRLEGRLVLLRQSLQKFELLKSEHPGQLFGTFQQGARKRLQPRSRKERDQFRKLQRGRRTIESVQKT